MFKQIKNSKNSILFIAAGNAIRNGLRETQTLISFKTSNFGERSFVSAAAEDSGITPPPRAFEGKDAADYGIPNSSPVAA